MHRLSLALARAGVRVFIPELAGVAGGELSPETLAQAVAVSRSRVGIARDRRRQVALVGVSVGGTLALLAAADSQLRQRVSVVACVAPFGDLADVMRLATTGTYRDGADVDAKHRRRTSASGLARSLAAMLAADAATTELCRELRALDYESRAPVELPERAFRQAGAEAERLYDLLANSDPAGSTALRRAAAHVRDAVVALSPIHVARRLHAPVEIAPRRRTSTSPSPKRRRLPPPHRRYVSPSRHCSRTQHPASSARNVAELHRLDAFFVRSLAAATS